jgi:tRNA(fMet)-specific endonuclease VapC
MKLCDTSVLVDIDRGGVDEKVRRLDEQGRHAISMVSVTELRLGVNLGYDVGSEKHGEAVDALNRLLARFEIEPVSRAVATAAADIIASLRGEGAPLNDLHDVYVAATARTEQLPVLTANVDHFERIEGVGVDDWTTF